MTSVTAYPRYTEVQRMEAAEWFVAIREKENPDEETLQGWLRWLEAAESHRFAFEAVERAWHGTAAHSLGAAMPSAAEVEADAYDGALPVAQWRALSSLERNFQLRRNFPNPRRRVARLSLAAAAIAGAALLFQPALEWFNRPSGAFSGEFATRIAEHLEVVLADGSRVALGARSHIVVNFTSQQRAIRLVRGEAFFTVDKDRTRPFRVHALNGVITALGTAFNVRTTEDRMVVAVTEGSISVKEDPNLPSADRAMGNFAASAGGAERRLNSGEQLTFSARNPQSLVEPTTGTESDGRMRWRDGWLVYRNEPLRYVIADVARYSEREVEVADESVAEMRFSGAVHRGDIDEWLAALPQSFPVTISSSDSHVVFRAR